MRIMHDMMGTDLMGNAKGAAGAEVESKSDKNCSCFSIHMGQEFRAIDNAIVMTLHLPG